MREKRDKYNSIDFDGIKNSTIRKFRTVLSTPEVDNNRIGNLTILGEGLNIKASNNPFRSKIEEYKKSVFLLNKDLVNNYKKFRFPQVDQRSEKLAEMAVKIWKI